MKGDRRRGFYKGGQEGGDNKREGHEEGGYKGGQEEGFFVREGKRREVIREWGQEEGS